MADGLVSGQRFAADASLIEADANKQNSTPKEDWDHSAIDPHDAPRAVRNISTFWMTQHLAQHRGRTQVHIPF